MKLQKKRNENNTCQIVSVNITVSFVSHVEDMIQVWGFKCMLVFHSNDRNACKTRLVSLL